MTSLLRSCDPDLRDLADEQPALMDADTGEPSGLRLVKWLGAGGMSAVFLAQRDTTARATQLSDIAPMQLAVKIIKPETELGLARMGMQSANLARREVAALERVKNLRPPSEFIIDLYGGGSVLIQQLDDSPLCLPWIALEYIEGSTVGTTLAERLDRTGDGGIDPVRAYRLARGVIEGMRVFHRLGVIHRDLKPDNVFIAGPVDDETPKIADCGIARVDGLKLGTMPGMTLGYGGPEQALSALRPFQSNPLVGTWSDVHALACTLWFVLGGEHWSGSMSAWNAGERRSLRGARRIHRGFLANEDVLDAIDRALQRGASPRLPEGTWDREGAAHYALRARQLFGASMFGDAPPRHGTVDELAAVLIPPLQLAAAQWIERAGREHKPITQFRRTRLLPPEEVLDAAVSPLAAPDPSGGRTVLFEPHGVVFLPGQWAFGRTGERLYCFSQAEEKLFDVVVPSELRRQVDETKWMTRGPGGGVALVGPSHVILLRGGEFSSIALPRRATGEPVGTLAAVLGDGRSFGVVTADAGEGGPELWLSNDGEHFGDPVLLPLGGDVHAIVSGPLGFFVAGGFSGKRARAMWLGYDQQAHFYIAGMNDKPPLRVAVAGTGGEAWAAGGTVVVRFDRGTPAVEASEAEGAAVAMGLDEAGVPWLLTEHEVLRRHGGADTPIWKRYHLQPKGAARLVAMGFPPGGVRIVDALGGGLLLRPGDFGDTQPVR